MKSANSSRQSRKSSHPLPVITNRSNHATPTQAKTPLCSWNNCDPSADCASRSRNARVKRLKIFYISVKPFGNIRTGSENFSSRRSSRAIQALHIVIRASGLEALSDPFEIYCDRKGLKKRTIFQEIMIPKAGLSYQARVWG